MYITLVGSQHQFPKTVDNYFPTKFDVSKDEVEYSNLPEKIDGYVYLVL